MVLMYMLPASLGKPISKRQEAYSAITLHLKEQLSRLERHALSLYLDGRSYYEIAKELNRQPKAIDNALQRVKHKIERLMGEKG